VWGVCYAGGLPGTGRDSLKCNKYVLKIARSQEEKEAIFRLRYKVYVDEMNKFTKYANHQLR
jgi:putative hemolysin